MPIIEAFWFIAAAYATNSFPPLVKGKIPIDFKKTFCGKRIFGDGKTIEGTVGGILFGLFIGMIQVNYQQLVPIEWGLKLVPITVPMVVLLCIGTMVGDIGGSFIKRRRGMERGARAFPMDQIGFLIMALLFVSAVFIPDLITIIILLIITPLIHLVSNKFGYFVKLKNKPW
jgi:CDP-2,3-bis-(O-geranylgeranyl)-sn-glycerol synthase